LDKDKNTIQAKLWGLKYTITTATAIILIITTTINNYIETIKQLFIYFIFEAFLKQITFVSVSF